METLNQLPYSHQMSMFIDHPAIIFPPSNQHKLHHLLLERAASHKINLMLLQKGRRHWLKKKTRNVRSFELQKFLIIKKSYE